MPDNHDTASDGSAIWKPFILNVGLVIVIFILGIFLGLIVRNRHLIENELQTRARSHFNNIVLTRRWNASYGGVFVKKTEGVVSNPYLENPDVTSADGVVYTKKNPALMTREISEIANENGFYTFHITSLNPLNPDNKADDFETSALRRFESGEKEVSTKTTRDGFVYYRYMAPLMTEHACLQCHAKQGYEAGDIRGGISVQFDITDIERSLKTTSYLFFGLGILAAAALFGVICVFTVQVMRRLRVAQKAIREMATTDGLTKLCNRTHFFVLANREIARVKRHGWHLSCLMLDVDFFKRFNDEHGHDVGDLVLESIGRILKDTVRTTDIPARYGGEEFVVLLPEADQKSALEIAERIRTAVESQQLSTPEGTALRVTISVGVATTEADSLDEAKSIAALTKSADEALYRAKENGRNRVETSVRHTSQPAAISAFRAQADRLSHRRH